MAPGASSPQPARQAGEVVLSPLQLALLQGLRDRPDGRAESAADLVRAALPYARVLELRPTIDELFDAIEALPRGWVSASGAGRLHDSRQLTWRGLTLLDGLLPARIDGGGRYSGAYTGMVAIRAKRALERRVAATDHWWRRVALDPAMVPLLERADRLVYEWSARNRVAGMWPNVKKGWESAQLSVYVRRYALRHGKLPTGVHSIPRARIVVDFDGL